MKVSVAMAAFNGEKFIEEQLASILSQTRPVDEVIICDDRSSDSSPGRRFYCQKAPAGYLEGGGEYAECGICVKFYRRCAKDFRRCGFLLRSGRHLASGTGCRDGAHFRKEPGDSASLFRI